jgi:hypothetical protein
MMLGMSTLKEFIKLGKFCMLYLINSLFAEYNTA